MPARLDGKSALVTGAAGGIGREMAVLFAAEGAAVTLVDLDERGLVEVAEEVTAAGGRATVVRADVSSPEDCAAMVDAAESSFGGLHVLCNNAGIMHADDAEPGGAVVVAPREPRRRP